jgi:S1-C subfamily serine protease
MRLKRTWIAALALLAAAPAAGAQEAEEGARQRPGMIGVSFAREGEVVRVLEVRQGSPAEAAGVRDGDVVVTVNGHPAGEHFQHLPHRLRAGETVRLQLRRDGAVQDLSMVAVPRPGAYAFGDGGGERRERIVIHLDSLERPLRELTFRIDSLQHRLLHLDSAGFRVRVDSVFRRLGDSMAVYMREMPNVRVEVLRATEAEARARERVAGVAARPFFYELGRRAAAGAELAQMNEGLSRYFAGQGTGALVIEVGPGTPAERAGLQAGDVIVRAGGAEVEGPADLRRHLSARAGSLPVQVIREGRRHDLTLEWEDAHGERVIIRGSRMD